MVWDGICLWHFSPNIFAQISEYKISRCIVNKFIFFPAFSIELHKTLKNPNWYKDVQDFFDLETQMIQQFPPGKKYREGNLKTSFIYLLIDPRISDNLPGQSRVSYYLIFTLNKFLSGKFYE